MTRAAVNPQPLAMSHSAAGPAPAVQQSSEAGSSWEEILQEFQWRYKVASRTHCFQYNIGWKHKRQHYVQVYEDKGYIHWVKSNWQVDSASPEQLRFLHYIHLREQEEGAVAEPVPQEPAEGPAGEVPDGLEQEAEAVTMEQLAARMERVELLLPGLMERLRISSTSCPAVSGPPAVTRM